MWAISGSAPSRVVHEPNSTDSGVSPGRENESDESCRCTTLDHLEMKTSFLQPVLLRSSSPLRCLSVIGQRAQGRAMERGSPRRPGAPRQTEEGERSSIMSLLGARAPAAQCTNHLHAATACAAWSCIAWSCKVGVPQDRGNRSGSKKGGRDSLGPFSRSPFWRGLRSRRYRCLTCTGAQRTACLSLSVHAQTWQPLTRHAS